jgi:hypothetical protein
MKPKQVRNRERLIRRIIESRTFGKFAELKQYISEIEGKFKSNIQYLSKRYDEEIAGEKIAPDIKCELYEYFAEEYHLIERVFLKTFRYTTVVAVYSLLETSFKHLCHYLCNSKKLPIVLEELRGDGIERAKLYLTKVCSVDFPENSNDWNQLQKLNRIRNCIVHADGNIRKTKSSNKLQNIVTNTNGLELYNDRYIQIDLSYIIASIAIAENVLGCMYERAL